jgi:transcriptional regulator with XRE-family HTH domain
MYGNPQKRTNSEVQELRREGGRWLKDLREKANLSQRQLATAVGAEYYTFVSQLETGRGRIPPDRYTVWAEALNVPPRDFVKQLMRYYDPVTFALLFDAE